MKGKGFTLIELLIVVAIIAILAAIAVPNFLEAQIRAKVTRTHSDFRMLATALEAYRVDSNDYPPRYIGGQDTSRYFRLTRPTTPVAYMTTIPTDLFFENEPTRGSVHPSGRLDLRAYPFWDPPTADGYKASATGYYRAIP